MTEYVYPLAVNPIKFFNELRAIAELPREEWIERRDEGTVIEYAQELTPAEKLLLDAAILAHIPELDARVTNVFRDDDGDTSIRLQNNPGSDEDVVIIRTDGVDRVTIGGTNFNSKMLDMVDDTGSDVRLHQIGGNGSAFHILKRSLGTIEAPLPVTAGTKIGGLAYQAEDGNDGLTFTIGAELASFATEDHDAFVGGQEMRIGVTPTGTKGRVVVAKFRGDAVELPLHADGRDDGPAPEGSVAYFGPTGEILRGSVEVPSPDSSFTFTGPDTALTTSTTFSTVQTLVAPGDGPAGTYELVVAGLISCDTQSSDIEARILIDGQQSGQSHRSEFKDSSGVGIGVDLLGGGTSSSGTDQRLPVYFRRILTLPADSEQTFAYQHRSTASNVESTTFDLQMTLEYKGP